MCEPKSTSIHYNYDKRFFLNILLSVRIVVQGETLCVLLHAKLRNNLGRMYAQSGTLHFQLDRIFLRLQFMENM